jgi:hypothetical protein
MFERQLDNAMPRIHGLHESHMKCHWAKPGGRSMLYFKPHQFVSGAMLLKQRGSQAALHRTRMVYMSG